MSVKSIAREFEYSLVAGLSSISKIVASFFRKLEQNLMEEKKREEVRALLELDDLQLRDMGISRDDVKASLMLPLTHKSGELLSKVRRENA